MKTVVLVPYRSDNGGRRDRSWRYVRNHLTRHHDYPIFMGESPEGPFNRSAAINHAADQCEWDVAVIVDADTFVPAQQLSQAVEIAKEPWRLVAAFTYVVELSRMASDKYLAGNARFGEGGVRRRDSELTIQSSALVVHRSLFERVGGFDENFVGWSAEDNAFWRACTLHAGDPARVEGPAYHLWHRPARPHWQNDDYQANQKRWQQYLAAQSVDELDALRCTQ